MERDWKGKQEDHTYNITILKPCMIWGKMYPTFSLLNVLQLV